MNRSAGYFYENKAIIFLKKKGHEIIYKNFYSPYGEIDLITFYQGKIRFIEVKYLSKINKLMPIEKINIAKLRRIFFSIAYLKKFSRINNYQVDAVSLYFKNKKLITEYLEDLRL
jgi:putative endonuclease